MATDRTTEPSLVVSSPFADTMALIACAIALVLSLIVISVLSQRSVATADPVAEGQWLVGP